MIIRFTKGKLPPRNFLLPVSKAVPRPGLKWDSFMETWKQYDETPDKPIVGCALWISHYDIFYSPDRATRYAETRVQTYKSIKQDGFKYEGWIIRAYGPPWNHIADGHTRISILRHLKPDAVIEVAGYDRGPVKR